MEDAVTCITPAPTAQTPLAAGTSESHRLVPVDKKLHIKFRDGLVNLKAPQQNPNAQQYRWTFWGSGEQEDTLWERLSVWVTCTQGGQLL